MNFHWDNLRSPTRPPIGTGEFQAPGLPRIAITGIRQEDVDMEFGSAGGSNCRFQSYGLRALAKFATELADQLEGK